MNKYKFDIYMNIDSLHKFREVFPNIIFNDKLKIGVHIASFKSEASKEEIQSYGKLIELGMSRDWCKVNIKYSGVEKLASR